MDILVMGASGLLGSSVVHEALKRGRSVGCTYHTDRPAFDVPSRQVDITDVEAVKETLAEFDPEHVVNCAAMTDVDECERWPRQASKINATAPGDLAERCSRSEIDFTHVSTDYVFDGDNPTRYAEDDEPNPLQVYGRSKLAGERAAMDAHEETLILRLSFVYGLDRSGTSPELRGFPAWVRSRYRSGYEVPLFTDQHVTPSRSGAAAATLLELHQTGATGRYHVAARTCVTPHEFGRRLIDEARIDGVRVTSTSSDAVSRLAERPLNTCLCVNHITERLRRPQPTLSADIRAIDDYL